MTISNMPLLVRSVPKWPKRYGFDVVGDGPCYVTAVEKGSIAYNAGLLTGDQILELDEQDVTNVAADAIKSLAKHSRTQPPTLGVVSRLHQVELVGNRTSGIGFDVQGERPVKVHNVEQASLAFQAGLRPGDIILEVNKKTVMTPEDMKPFLSGRLRRLTLSIVPIGRQSEAGTLRKVKHTSPSGGSRIKRARSIHEKMNEILGDDYEKKMAVVSVLKQYAEDRDVDMLARALSVILKTSQQQKIILQIRQFIPPRQRRRFDELIKQYPVQNTDNKTPNSPGPIHKYGQRRNVQVVREAGSFGFVIKGNNPVHIESIDPGGAAEKAGLQAGDYIIGLNGIDVRRCSHSHLVQLLQDSGTSPMIEVLRSPDGKGLGLNGLGTTSVTSASSTSSHISAEWMADQKPLVDRDGKTFKEKVNYLLTSKERVQVRKAMRHYDSNRNIVDLFTTLNNVLDTPSKKSLWAYIIAKLPQPHQEFCVNKINLPRHVLLEMLEPAGIKPPYMKDVNVGKTPEWLSKNGVNGTADNHQQSVPHLSSFQQQVDYLLTSRERLQLKKALQIYAENRKADNLIQDLEVILDTPSKQTLWMYIIPLLITEHQDYAREKLNIGASGDDFNPDNQYPMDSYIGDNSTCKTGHTTDDEYRYVGLTATALRRGRENMSSFSSEDDIRERTMRSGVKRARGRLWKKMHPGYDLYPADDEDNDEKQVKGFDSALMRELEETRKVVKDAKKAFKFGHKAGEFSDSDDEERYHLTKYVTVIPIGYQFIPEKGMYAPNNHSNVVNGKAKSVPNGLQVPPEITFSTSSDSENEVEHNPARNRFSIMSGDSFNRHALTALKELDAAMAAEVSDLETNISNADAGKKKELDVKSPQPSKTSPPVSPPAPPPPAPPPPPPPPPGAPDVSPSIPQMNVKRINWEKLDQVKLRNTVWEQIGNDDLDDVVKYLELEQHFSTIPSPRTKPLEKRNEIFILNPKKAYNISILLGHLKMDVTQMKQALFMMDKDILTPDLLKQLLAFAPDVHEMDKYDSFDGYVDDLSKPDRFAFEMSRVPGYEQRLKALLFKENFREKIQEMKENLQCIRKASNELRHSKKLAKILELILAMGNYMNKGNQRVGEAAGFRVRFLSQLDITKTKDNKATFLHVLADTVYTKFPEVLSVGQEMTTIPEACKVSNVTLNQELQELRKVLQDISNTLDKFGSQKTSIGVNDRFQDVMGHFISQASDEIQGLFRLQANSTEEFHNMVQYFGEDPKKMTTTEFFGIFSEFVTKFESAHRHNMMFKRH